MYIYIAGQRVLSYTKLHLTPISTLIGAVVPVEQRKLFFAILRIIIIISYLTLFKCANYLY